MSQLSLNNKYIAEALSPEQRKKAQEILDKESGADKRKEQAAAARERSERRKDKELELKAANLKIRQDREARRSQADDQRKAAKKKAETVKKVKEYGDKAKTALDIKKEVVSDKDGDGTALGKIGSNVGRTAAGVGKAIYNKVKERQEKKKIKEETSMKNVPIKDRKSIKERGKNLFKKDLTGSVMNANESADASGNSDIKAQQKKQDMIKKRVLMAKLRAVRSGGGESITASYNPELVVISEVDGDTKKEKIDKIIDVMRGKNKIEVNPPVKAEGYTVKEHHQKDADGKVIEHEDEAPGTPSSVEEGVVDMVKKGAKRHSKAIEKKKIKNRKAVPYAALAAEHQPEGDMIEDYHSGTGEKVQKRTLAWMKKKGQKGAPGLDAMKAREAEHKAKRGVKEEAGCETKKIENKGKKKIDPNKNPAVKEDVRIADAKGRDFLEIIDIIKPEPMKSPKNTVQWNEEKIAKLMKKANEKKRKNALQINKIVGTQ